ncbi:gluconeogenesis factor YvcK family protein [Granulicoccus sp. GXG6511]|uniref:gluconeogenesis factor YvcK family protein n=1 Tax=Granulicoccus sp. GXG6511 TaxID=3381351 RepID=UPI003D7C8A29
MRHRFDLAFDRLPGVTAFGGGHGLAASLSALRRVTDRLTAVVTVADDGGSSGRLRAEFDCLPPGDLRMALAALCGDDHWGRTWADVLQSRFGGEGALGGHAIGNLLIAGLWEKLGDAVAGLDLVGELLNAKGRVLPMSSVPLDIVAEVIGLDPMQPDEISEIRGQSQAAKTSGEVRGVRLEPADPPARPEVLEVIAASDFVVLGPGSWFTSVIPHLLVPEIAEALVQTPAKRILTLNLRPADETDGYSASQHVEILADHAPRLRLDTIVADASFARDDRHLPAYAQSLGARLVLADLALRDGTPRHDPLRLASIYAEVMGV